jgi:hypothetical protein
LDEWDTVIRLKKIFAPNGEDENPPEDSMVRFPEDYLTEDEGVCRTHENANESSMACVDVAELVKSNRESQEIRSNRTSAENYLFLGKDSQGNCPLDILETSTDHASYK